MIYNEFLKLNEYCAAGLYEEEERSLFYRKALGIRRFYENCALAEYKGNLLYPSGLLPINMQIYPRFAAGITMRNNIEEKIDKNLLDTFKKDFLKSQSYVPYHHKNGGDMFTHSIPNYERVLKEGLLSYVKRIEKIEDKDLKEGLIHVIEGIKTYIDRIIDYLTNIGADEKLIIALKRVPLYPARDIYEAIVSWNFVMYLDNCDNLGCLDKGLIPYHKGEDITDLLENLYDNLDVHNGYSMSLHPPYNDLTVQCLEASKGKRRPMIELLINEDTPDYIWKKAFEVIKTGNGQPAFYNERVIKKELVKRFPNMKKDIDNFCGGGCTEAMIAGYSCVGSLDAGINLLLILEETIDKHLENSKTFNEFYDKYIKEVEVVVNDVTKGISKSQYERALYQPLPMRTLLIDDCIDNMTEYNAGGARYKYRMVNFAGMINVIDSLLVIRDFVYNKKLYDAKTLINLLNENNKEFLEKARNHDVCFGIDNDDANEFSYKISHDIYTLLDGKKTKLGEEYVSCAIQFRSQAAAGRDRRASCDGRKKGEPLCDSLAAILGKDVKGPTSLLKSVASLDLKNAIGIPVLSFNITADFKDEILKSLILGYMRLGGIQMQISCVSKETLEDAYKNPDMHKNLVVRVGGYSDYFNNLSDELKKMIINRSIQKLG